MAKISKRVVDGLLAKEKPYTHWDTETRGFGVRVMPTGTKTYVLQYRVGRKQHMLKLGRHGHLTPEGARTEAVKHLGSIAGGSNPADEKAMKRAALTFADLVKQFLEAKASGAKPRRASTLSDYRRYLDAYSQPLAKRSVADLPRSEIAAQIARVQRERGPAVARAYSLSLSSFWGWAMRQGHCEANPVLLVEKPAAPEARDRVLSEDEVVAVWRATADASDYSRIVRLLLLSGQRLREIAWLRWSEVDLDRGLIAFDRDRIKNRTQHVLPISDPMRAILEGIERREGSPYVFGKRQTAEGKEAAPFSGFSKAQRELLTLIGGKSWSPHDLRRTFRSMGADIGIEPYVAEAILNHLPQGVQKHYDFAKLVPQKSVALRRWGDHVLGLVGEAERGKVVKFGRR